MVTSFCEFISASSTSCELVSEGLLVYNIFKAEKNLGLFESFLIKLTEKICWWCQPPESAFKELCKNFNLHLTDMELSKCLEWELSNTHKNLSTRDGKYSKI